MSDGMFALKKKLKAGILFLALGISSVSASAARPMVIAKAPVTRLAAVSRPAMASTTAPVAAPTVAAPEEKNDLMSFQQWKQEKIREAAQKLEEARKEGSAAKKSDDEGEAYQAEWNLETAQELEVTDYIVLYLSQFAGSKKFEEAAARLTKTEIATVMERYISMIQRGNKQRNNTDAKAAGKPTTVPAVQALIH